MPIYKTVSTLQDKSTVRLVEAQNVAAARSHVAKEMIAVEVCDTAEAIALGNEGVKLERAGNGS